ncbi:protein-cysteine N-palmitoyltransferase Rasp [Epargyreus clarus]|uniref:protein-cysteine N-palmitoyltransferase Rasp n=1 Tax=Epargyreus clarus TaxID=520877 RepID=UPI003C2F770E
MKTSLNSFELYLCFCVWTFSNIYSLYKLIKAQTDVLQREDLSSLRDLQPGWTFISRYKDVSDIEWSSWKYFFQTSWYYLIIQFMISEIIRKLFASWLKYWYIMSTVIFITMGMGLRQMIIISVQPVIYAFIINFGGNKFTIWLTSILLLLSYNSLKYKYFFWNFLDHDDMQDEEVYLILFSVAWIELRCISYCIDFIDKQSSWKKYSNLTFQDVINMFSYVLYLPLLYTGPIILYEEFEKSFNVIGGFRTKLRKFIWDMMFYLTYTICLDVAFHYIYFFAMQNNMELIRKLPSIALCGGGLWMGLQFHMKYVISYGTTSSFARLDNIEPPPTPRCIARVHVYSEMWRHFDVGLYKFLVKYIYKPGYNTISKYSSIPKTAHKLLASLATFTFIFMWHGTVWHILVWSFLNYVGITLEHLGKVVSTHEKYQWFKTSILKTDKMEARFIGLLCTPLLALSAISNFYLFAGSEIGNLFFECFSQPSMLNLILLGTTLYCCCQVSMALQNVPSRSVVKKC